MNCLPLGRNIGSIMLKEKSLTEKIFTRSWLIGEKLVADGRIFLATPVHPVLLVLPYLYQVSCRDLFMDLTTSNTMIGKA